MRRAITITSGKGGVGKTNVSLNLALYLSQRGYKTCLFDADFGLANINILLGLQPKHDLKDVILNGKKIQDIILKIDDHMDILPGSSGIEEMANLNADRIEILSQELSEMPGYDFLIFDTSAGISNNVISLCLATPEVVLLITPEPTSLTDAFALLKVLTLNGFKGEAKVVLNQCKNADVANLVYKKFQSAVLKYLALDVQALGIIYPDANVAEAVKQQRPFLRLYPDTTASKCIKKIGERLLSNTTDHLEYSDIVSFWNRCLQLIRSPLNMPGKERQSDKKGVESLSPGSGEKDQHTIEASQKGTFHGKEGGNEVKDNPPVSGVGTNPQEGAMDMGPYIMPIMEKLIGGISCVSTELKLLREAIEGNVNAPLQFKTSPECPSLNRSDPKPIRLDFEAFLKRQGIYRKES